MGLPIGQAPVAINALAGTRSVRSVSFFERSEKSGPRLLGRDPSTNKPSLFRTPKEDTPRTGLGANITSTPAAALNTVSRTVREVKELVPTIKELQVGFRRQASESRSLAREEFQNQFLGALSSNSNDSTPSAFSTQSTNRVEFRLPNPSTQVRNFVGALNDTARDLQAKFSGEEIAPPTTGASFQINGQSFPVRDTSSGSRLNITI